MAWRCSRSGPHFPALCGSASAGFRAPVDRALESLRRPTTVEDRLGVLKQLVEFWHGPIRPEDGMSAAELAGVPLPMPLRWWYRWAGKRDEIMSGQNILYKPVHKYWQLTVDGDHLRFYCENQGVHFWSTLTHGEDPPVFGRYNSADPWEREDITLSEHLILACLLEAVSCHAYGAFAPLDTLSVDHQQNSAGGHCPVAMGGEQVFCRARRLHVGDRAWLRGDRRQGGAPAPIS